MKLKEYTKYFSAAWELLIDLPLPKFLKDGGVAKKYGIEVQYAFPLIGLVFGCLVIVAGILLSGVKPVAAAIIFAVPMAILMIIKDSGRSLGALVSFVELKTEKVSTVAALYNMRSEVRDVQSMPAVISIVIIMLFYLLAFFLVSLYNFYYWMIMVLVFSFTIQAALAALPLYHDKTPIIATPKRGRNHLWSIAGFIALFILFQAPYATLITAALAFFATKLFSRFVMKNLGGISTKIIGLAGLIFEIVALLLGIVFLAA